MTLNVIDKTLAEKLLSEGNILLNEFNCERDGLWIFNMRESFALQFDKEFADKCFISKDLKLTF